MQETVKNILNQNIKKGISIFCGCSNRTENIEIASRTWLKCSDVNEIVIVDWNSTEPLILNHPKLTIVRVNNVKWKNSAHAFNLAARFTSYDKICKLDADYLINRNFFTIHELRENDFFAGQSSEARDSNEKHIHGFLYLKRKDFFEKNVYNERVETYGWEDSDMYERLEEGGLDKRLVNLDKIYHLKHDDSQRVSNAEEWWLTLEPEDLTAENRILCRKNPWAKKDSMMDFKIEKDLTSDRYICEVSNAE